MGSRFAHGAAGAVAVLGVVLAALCAHGLRSAEASFSEMLGSYGLTNLAIGVSLLTTGTVLAVARPRIVIGWLFQLAGICYLISAATLAVLPLPGREAPVLAGVPGPVAGALYFASWPLAIGILLPLALLCFPEGRLGGRVNVAVAALVGLTGTAFWAAFALFPGDGTLANSLGLPAANYAQLQGLWAAANLGNLAAWLTVCGVLIARYVRGDESTKRRMLWLILALLAALAITVPFTLFGLGDVGVLAAFILIPVGVIIGVLRYRLLDIRLAVARTLVWLLLAGIVLAADLLLVALLTPLITLQPGPVAIAALLVALAAEPVRRLLHRGIDRIVFGRHSREAVTRLLRERIVGATDSAALVEGLRQSLGVAGLRYEVTGLGIVAESGRLDDENTEHLALTVRGEAVGVLVVGVRRGDAGLRRADRSLLTVVEPVLGVLARSLRLQTALAASRSSIVEAAEVERRRLQRDLHDGVASALTGVQFKLDAARAQISHGPADQALGDASSDLRHMLATLRLVIDDLRPPELDRLGLAAALRARWAHAVSHTGAAVAIRVDARLPATLPAAIEVAAYRIAVEATTNALRHSAATTIHLDLEADTEALAVRVADDGGCTPDWHEGTGMRSMRERAEQLGGNCTVTATKGGMTIEARLPFPPVQPADTEAVSAHA